MLDYDLAHRSSEPRRLPQNRLHELHDLLACVSRKGRLTLSDYPPITAVIARLLASSPEQTAPAGPVPLFEQVSNLLRTPAPLATWTRKPGISPTISIGN